ncbi:MAG: DUF937 domain-containing protein, partial [Pseudomonadota bacterium]
MSLMKMLMEAQGGQGLGKLAEQFGIDEAQLGGLAGMIGPAISQGAKRRAQQPGGMEALASRMMGEDTARYLDDPAQAAAPEAQAEGMDFLEQILGSREATHELQSAAAERSGVSTDLVGQIMPAIAAMMQGGMQRQMPDTQLQGLMQGLELGVRHLALHTALHHRGDRGHDLTHHIGADAAALSGGGLELVGRLARAEDLLEEIHPLRLGLGGRCLSWIVEIACFVLAHHAAGERLHPARLLRPALGTLGD